MTEQTSAPTAGTPPVIPADAVVPVVNDRTRPIDRCFELLADRRRRFCLYHLHRAATPLEVRDLAALVETSVTPTESDLTEEILEEAVLRLVHAHLPKLRDAGLVALDGEWVELAPDPPAPIEDWLSATAAVELGLAPRPPR